jgi:hypothetical protein
LIEIAPPRQLNRWAPLKFAATPLDMEQRNLFALISGIALGIIWCVLLTGAGFPGAGGILLLGILVSPLVVALIARTKLLLFAIVPNVMIGGFFSIVGALSPYNRTPEGGFTDETWTIVPIVLGISVGAALLLAGGVWFVRTVWWAN